MFLGSENAEAIFRRSLTVHISFINERSSGKIGLSRERVCCEMFKNLILSQSVLWKIAVYVAFHIISKYALQAPWA